MLNPYPSLFEASVTGSVCGHDHATVVFGDEDVLYYPHFFDAHAAHRYARALHESVDWKQQEIRMYGRSVPMPRLTAWYGDPGVAYTYSGLRNEPAPWNDVLLDILAELYAFTGYRFNSVLLNRYRDGNDSISWHADDEPELGESPIIASLSFGAARTFKLRKTESGEEASIVLESGSLLMMRGASQHVYRHCVPKERKALGERLNLTFRVVSTGTVPKKRVR
jgi:alkylated DNA repair dioxygenase AlkB